MSLRAVAAALAVVLSVAAVAAAAPVVAAAPVPAEHRYSRDPPSPVAVIASKVGPWGNPSESYDYYKLPFCRPRRRSRAPGRPE